MKEKTIFTGARSIVAQITNAIVIMAHRAPGGTYQIVGSAKVYQVPSQSGAGHLQS